jgi:hypothetical protein
MARAVAVTASSSCPSGGVGSLLTDMATAEITDATLGNLLLLCRRHHRLVHEGEYGADERGRFSYPWGAPVDEVPPLPRAGPADLRDRNRDLEIDALTCETGTGDPLDLAVAVDVLLRVPATASRTCSGPTGTRGRPAPAEP